jgi:hypothetical protein
MGGVRHSSARDLLFLVVVAAQLFVISGCMDKYRAADKHVEAMDKRMKQIEKDAARTK